MPGEESEAHKKYAVLGDKGCEVRSLMLMGPGAGGLGGGGAPSSPPSLPELLHRLVTNNAVARARGAVCAARGASSSSPLLFAGITFLLHGEWECPPKNISHGDAVELITLAGGRVVDVNLGHVHASATPSLGEMQDAACDARDAMEEEEEGGADALIGRVRFSGLSCALPASRGRASPLPASSLASGQVQAAETDSSEWGALCLALARQHGPAFIPLRGGGTEGSLHAPALASSPPCSPPCPVLIVLCDEPQFALPPALQALHAAQLSGEGGGGGGGGGAGGTGRAPHPPIVPVLTPEWLLDCVSCYARLAPRGWGVDLPLSLPLEVTTAWVHPAYGAWMRRAEGGNA